MQVSSSWGDPLFYLPCLYKANHLEYEGSSLHATHEIGLIVQKFMSLCIVKYSIWAGSPPSHGEGGLPLQNPGKHPEKTLAITSTTKIWKNPCNNEHCH